MCSGEVMAKIPKWEKAALCPLEEMDVWDKSHAGMNYGAVGREFNANESTIDAN